jgi:ferredoxin
MGFSDVRVKRRDFLSTTARAGAALSSGALVTTSGGCARSGDVSAKPHRHIDPSRCIGCGQCLSLCPMGAIRLSGKSSIDPDECVECGVCWRSRICPTDAIQPGDLRWPRVIREEFSNPIGEHKSTGVAGRGTEETKTNDSENRYQRGQIGVLVELGRPAVGTRLFDVEKAVKRFKAHGYELVQDNPVVDLIADPETGAFKPEVLNEKIISCVVEFIVPESDALRILQIARELGEEVRTVFNLSVALRADDHGNSPLDRLFGPDTFRLPQAKVNIGFALGILVKAV